MNGVKEKVLKALRQKNKVFVSGEELSKSLGVSRTAVWKAIQALRAEGYGIFAQHRQGYCLADVPDLLLPSEVGWGLETKWLGKEIYYNATLSSTNDAAKELARQGAREGTLVVTEEQTRGKGRRGRSWDSPYKQGLLFSVILRPDLPPVQAPQLTLLAAVVLAETFRTELRLPAKIKWPNDVYIGGRKVAGILTELSAEVDSINFIIMGIGINVNTNIEELPLSLRNKVTSLKLEIGTKIARVQLLQALLLKLEHFYTEYLRRGSGFVLDRWRQFALYLGQQVQVLTSHENFVGKAIDIDEYGALLVEVKPGVVRRVLAGDVSLRPESYEK